MGTGASKGCCEACVGTGNEPSVVIVSSGKGDLVLPYTAEEVDEPVPMDFMMLTAAPIVQVSDDEHRQDGTELSAGVTTHVKGISQDAGKFSESKQVDTSGGVLT
mmetsp:Transcript_42412/g.77001  ORF Transcript_42412/g.77001 Transcript_42412/m.77001 type:complete len:105 (+) Transcript_42412:40-354(+)